MNWSGERNNNIPKVCPLSDRAKITRKAIFGTWVRDTIDIKKVVFSDEFRFSLDHPDHLYTQQ